MVYYCKRCHRIPVPNPGWYCKECARFCIDCQIRERAGDQRYCKKCKSSRNGVYWTEKGANKRRVTVRRANPELWRLHIIRNRATGYYRWRPEARPNKCEFCGSMEHVKGMNIGAVHDRPFWILWLCFDHYSKLDRLTGYGRPQLQKNRSHQEASKPGRKSAARAAKPQGTAAGRQAPQAEGEG